MRSEASLFILLAGEVFGIDGKGSIIVNGMQVRYCGRGAIDVLRWSRLV